MPASAVGSRARLSAVPPDVPVPHAVAECSQEVLLKFDLTTTSTIADLKQVVHDKLAEKVAVRVTR